VIPPFEINPGEDGHYQLPPGIHVATWPELVERFGTNERRRELLAGLLRALQALNAAGCRRAFIDGSFVTSKDVPGDFDGCWDHDGVDFDVLDPVLLNFDGHREAQKAKFEGELFIAAMPADELGIRFLDFFQLDRDGRSKGIIQIDLKDIA
jgi:hypothetical protein